MVQRLAILCGVLVSASAFWTLGMFVGGENIPAIDADEKTGELEQSFSETEIGFEEAADFFPGSSIPPPPPLQTTTTTGRIQWARYWLPFTFEEEKYYRTSRPAGPVRVGIQAGHWHVESAPEELQGLNDSTGAFGGGYSEQETVLTIARIVKEILEEHDVVVDLLPATVPVDYRADAFISIHADGSASAGMSGFKIGEPRRDFSGRAEALVSALYDAYEKETGLSRDNNITRRMSGYYAFNWRRYDHAVHPMTPAVIIETGFMTNAFDRAVIVKKPEIAARGIANGILIFLGLL